MSAERTFVIVGASLAGAKAAEELRAKAFDGSVILIGEETERPYERPPLSKDFLQGKVDREKVYVHSEGWYANNDIDLRLGVTVTSIDRASRVVQLSDGSEQHYDKLLLATGSVVRRIPNTAVEGVHYLRRLTDAEALREAFVRGGHVVVVGGGWIGLEGAAAARHHGCAVTLIEPEPSPLHRVLGPEIGGMFTDLHRDHGVTVKLGVGMYQIQPGPLVTTSAGEEISADAVLIGVGITPATTLAEHADLEVDDGIRVNQYLQTTRDPDIYAAGDCMNADHPRYGQPLRVEHWANALNAGPAAARSMLGLAEPYDRVPYFFSDQYDLGLEFSGWFAPGDYARIVYRGDPARREFIAFWLDSAGCVLAGMNVNVWDVTDPIRALIQSRQPIDAAALADPDVPLQQLAESSARR